MEQLINFPGYYINKEGEIFSLVKQHNHPQRDIPRKLKTHMHKKGYRAIDLVKDGKRYKRTIHRLLLETYVGECPKNYECRHLNGNPRDNRLENLAWGSHADNMADKKLTGTNNLGEKHGLSKLTEDKVREIKRLAMLNNKKIRSTDKGGNYKEIAKIYGVSTSAIGHIVRGSTWSHVAIDIPDPDGVPYSHNIR